MEEPQLFFERNFLFCPRRGLRRQIGQFLPATGKLRHAWKLVHGERMPNAKCLPRFIAEKQRAVSAINGKAFIHGLKQRLVEGIKRRQFRLKVFERGQLPVQPVRGRPVGQIGAGMGGLKLPIMRTDGVAKLLQTQSDFAIDDQKIFQLRDGRGKYAGNQQRTIGKQAMKIGKQKICSHIYAGQHADKNQ